jgi:hypothetical protein
MIDKENKESKKKNTFGIESVGSGLQKKNKQSWRRRKMIRRWKEEAKQNVEIDCVTVGRSNNVLLTYLLTQWSRFLLEKLIGLQLVKKFPAFCGTRRFINAFTSSRHLSLS